MPSITTWTRLEPRIRTDDMGPSLAGQLFDPSWLLGRRWQIGEFVGDDAGSPISASLQLTTIPIAAYQSGSASAIPYDGAPLDALAGPEEPGAMTLLKSAEAGEQLQLLLASHGCNATGAAALVHQYPLGRPTAASVDAQGVSYLQLLASRLVDASAIEGLVRQAVATGVVPGALAAASRHRKIPCCGCGMGMDGFSLKATPKDDAWTDASLDTASSWGSRNRREHPWHSWHLRGMGSVSTGTTGMLIRIV
jgi:hypothetical protein